MQANEKTVKKKVMIEFAWATGAAVSAFILFGIFAGWGRLNDTAMILPVHDTYYIVKPVYVLAFAFLVLWLLGTTARILLGRFRNRTTLIVWLIPALLVLEIVIWVRSQG